MGWHKILGPDRLGLLLAGKRVDKLPGKDPLFLARGTANFVAMAGAGELLRAYRYGTPAEQKEAHAAAAEVVGSQLSDGLLTVRGKCEQGAPDPHFNYHAVAVAAIRLAAIEFGLADLLVATGAWYRRMIWYLDEIATPDGQVLGPGFRGKGGPHCQVADLLLREVTGRPHQRPVGRGEGGVWNEWRFAGAGQVRKLLRSGDDLGGAGTRRESAWLRVPVVLTRWEGGHLAVMERENVAANAVEPIDWVRVEYGPVGQHRVTWGEDWKTPPPQPPAGKLKSERIQ